MRPAKVVAGQVLSVEAHPNGEFIRLAMVDIGEQEPVQIVFGGPDLVVKGDFVPVALPGARLPGRKKMRRTSFRGKTSHGMLCSAMELGWESDGPDEVALLRPGTLIPGDSLEDVDWSDLKADETADHLAAREHWQRHRYGVELSAGSSTPDGLRVQAPAVG